MFRPRTLSSLGYSSLTTEDIVPDCGEPFCSTGDTFLSVTSFGTRFRVILTGIRENRRL